MTMRQDPTDPTGVKDLTPRGNSEVSKARLRKAKAAIAMRREGQDWDTVAETLGYPTPRMALVATERALVDELQTPESQAFMRRLASERFDALLEGVWAKATDPDGPEHLAAVASARSLINDLVKLHGLQAPTEHVITNPSQSDIETWVAKVIQKANPTPEEGSIFDLGYAEDDEETEGGD